MFFHKIKDKCKNKELNKKINIESHWVDDYSTWYGDVQSLIHKIDDNDNICLSVYINGKRVPLSNMNIKKVLNTSSDICKNMMTMHSKNMKELKKQAVQNKNGYEDIISDDEES